MLRTFSSFPDLLIQPNSKGENFTSMKPIRNVFLTALTLATLSAGSWAQPSASAAPTQPAVTAADIQALKDALAAQQQQILALQEELHRKNKVADQAESTAAEDSA